jgi:hypothetical protein
MSVAEAEVGARATTLSGGASNNGVLQMLQYLGSGVLQQGHR